MDSHSPSSAPTTRIPSFIRVSLLVFTLLIIYASWYPFIGWRTIGLSPFDFLHARWPYYWTFFDIWTNIAGYAPFGLLVVYALYPAIRSAWSIPVAIIAGFLLSGTMEAVQTYLPTRVPSNIDLVSNTLGTALGAIIGFLTRSLLVSDNILLALRKKWFASEASHGLVIICLWPLALVFPQTHLFGLGNLVALIQSWIPEQYSSAIRLGGLLFKETFLSIEAYWLADVFVTMCGLCASVLTLMQMLRPAAPRKWLVTGFLVCMVCVKALSSALFFTPDNAFAWVTPGIIGGALVSLPMVLGLGYTPARVQRRFAIGALILGLVITNVIPDNPYFVESLQMWGRGIFLNFNGAAQFLSVLLPFLALWYLTHPVHRRHPVA